MDILEETLERLKTLYKTEQISPGVLTRAALMPKWNAVIGTNGQCGISMNFTDCQQAFGKPQVDIARLQKFVGANLFDLASAYVRSKSWQEKSIGVSAISALSQPLITAEAITKRGFRVLEEAPPPDSLLQFGALLQPDDVAVIVGYGGKIEQLVGKCREIHVTDIRPREAFQTLLVDQQVSFTTPQVLIHGETDNRKVIPQASAVLISGSSLVNGTIDELLGYAQKARVVRLWGPSASVIPDVLFDRGLNFLDTVRVSSPEAFARSIMQNQWDLKMFLPNEQKKLVVTRR
jgi:uncharacterized protein (DUF4213/DUF364 family)